MGVATPMAALGTATGTAQGLVPSASAPARDKARTVALLAEALGCGPFAAVVFFASEKADFPRLSRAMARRFPGADVLGCTTAGEIDRNGYSEGQVVAFALPRSHFTTAVASIETLSMLDRSEAARAVLSARHQVTAAEPGWGYAFAMLMVDGLSRAEDRLVASIIPALGTTPLFGGSAGDGLSFGRTRVLSGGRSGSDRAAVLMVRTRCPVNVFRFDSFRPTGRRMVVTGADPARRLVTELNAEPAALEYARIVGKDPVQLSPFTFAANPVVIRLGGQQYVRAIQKVEPNGDLTFFSAIEEGLVLTVAEPTDMVPHLDASLTGLGHARKPAAIIGCDCILRRLEAEQNQSIRDVSAVLSRHGVVGFSTYGEQHNGVHVNHTLTGVAIYPPGTA
ncbi:MAG: FIST N-terminal domain-containing protein [Pseudomonadota bacterium]